MPHTFRETMRLRHALGDQASSWGKWPTLLREAKLVSVRGDEAANTPKLDFELFVKVYSEIDVLWLSSVSFISSRAVSGWNEKWGSTYSIQLFTYAGEVNVNVYTLSPSERWQQTHLRPISFLRDLMKDELAGYLATIRLRWASFCPTSLLMSFLSMLPSSVTSTGTDLNSRGLCLCPKPVKVRFDNYLSSEQFDAVLSHQVIPYVMLDVPSFNAESTEDEKADEIRLTNYTLRKCSKLRHAVIPDHFLDDDFSKWNAGDVPFTISPHLESLEFQLYAWDSWAPIFLRGISRNQNIQHLVIFVSVQYFDWSHLKQLLDDVLPGHGSLKSVKIMFGRDPDEDNELDDEDDATDDDEDYGCPLEGFVSLLAELKDSVTQLNLLHFTVMFTDEGTEERIVSSFFQDYWDKYMVPILALNWHRSQQDKRIAWGRQEPKRRRLRPGLTPALALRVLDVNRGNIYHLVTESAPSCEMAPTNATLIYQLLRETDAFKAR
jgi:hypothetical protein